MNKKKVVRGNGQNLISGDGDYDLKSDNDIYEIDDDSGDNDYESPDELENLNKPIFEEKLNMRNYSTLATNAVGRKINVLSFNIEAVLRRESTIRLIGSRYNLTFKRTDCKLVRTILNAHGFHEVSNNSSEFNVMWSGSHIRPYSLRTFLEYQKVNHFPRSFELTRKDRLFKNIQRMQTLRGLKHFDFVPPSFLVPSEYQDLCQHAARDKGPYIVKPVALSRGRGIFLCNHPNQIPMDEQLIASKYINNPYLIDGLKFDLRLYVLVTSFDPLVAYVYEEGLTRFATVKYQNSVKHLRSQCMHLTNYSVNKRNESFVQNEDADVENIGNKWSLGALLRHLKSKDVDTTCLMMKIEDIIVKSLIAVEPHITTACRMFQPYRGNCFEMYGYDIIVDDNLRPWLLEVNLSPSLSCDSPLDFKIKSHMLTDMFNLIGIACHDPRYRTMGGTNARAALNGYFGRTTRSSGTRLSPSRFRNSANANSIRPSAGLRQRSTTNSGKPNKSFFNEENRMVRRVIEEDERRGGWIRIFPTAQSLDTYGAFLNSVPTISAHDSTVASTYNGGGSGALNLNRYLYSKLYSTSTTVAGDGDSHLHNQPQSQQLQLQQQQQQHQILHRNKPSLHSVTLNSRFHTEVMTNILPTGSYQQQYQRILHNYSDTRQRVPYYERKLGEEAGAEDGEEGDELDDEDENEQKDQAGESVETASDDAEVENDDNNSDDDDEEDEDNDEAEENGQDVQDDAGYDCDKAGELTLKEVADELKEIQTILSTMTTEEDAAAGDKTYSTAITQSDSAGEGIINMGGKLTVLQARFAFGHYLSCVQRRLLTESVIPSSNGDKNNQTEIQANIKERNDQVDLILRFLQRASASSGFQLPSSVPDRDRTSLRRRQEWLANVLGGFISLYCRETASAANDINGIQGQVNPHRLLKFLREASEVQLERLLSNYTKVNKSAGIFINPHCTTNSSINSNKSPYTSSSSTVIKSISNNQPGIGLHRSSSTGNLQHKQSSLNKPLFDKPHNIADRPLSSNNSSSNNNSSFRRPGSTKLGSASIQRPQTTNTYSKNRADSGTGNATNVNAVAYDSEAISRTLQRIASDRRSRQLTASMSCLEETHHQSHNHQHSQKQNQLQHQMTISQQLLKQYNQSKQDCNRNRQSQQNQQKNPPITSNILLHKPPPSGIQYNVNSKSTLKRL